MLEEFEETLLAMSLCVYMALRRLFLPGLRPKTLREQPKKQAQALCFYKENRHDCPEPYGFTRKLASQGRSKASS